jgi:hypothetical protein
MSTARFSPITSLLLARKGEARPWNQAAKVEAENVASITWRPYTPSVIAAPPSPNKDRTCSIRISAHDFERLGILAVKRNSTRQQLLKEALAEFLAVKAQDYGCACLHDSPVVCNKDCGSEG